MLRGSSASEMTQSTGKSTIKRMTSRAMWTAIRSMIGPYWPAAAELGPLGGGALLDGDGPSGDVLLHGHGYAASSPRRKRFCARVMTSRTKKMMMLKAAATP